MQLMYERAIIIFRETIKKAQKLSSKNHTLSTTQCKYNIPYKI
jgi:hypothetical protein